MIEILTKAHSGLRWVVLALILLGIARGGVGSVGPRKCAPSLWHPALMLTAAVSVHLGTIFARRLKEDRRKHYAHLLAYLVGLLFVLLGVYAVRGSLF
jgi:hypothetical protein